MNADGLGSGDVQPSETAGMLASAGNDTGTRAVVGESHGNLRQKTARGALISVVGQGANFTLRTISMIVMARLVTPEHFGLVGMVTAFTGFLGLFRDAGLSQATVQRAVISDDITSTLFWINVAIGAALAGLTALLAPAIAAFFNDPRLFWITVALGSGFLFGGAAAQHRALMHRKLRFGVVAAVDLTALVCSIVVGISMALAGAGYWALVGMAVSLPAVGLVLVWLATGWVPGAPRRGSDVWPMLHYGGLITINGLLVYLAYNADKVLIGRFWGAETLGVYGRAYQLISLPTENLQSTVSWVMFPVLSRLQGKPGRTRSYFLKGYGLFLSVVMPITVACWFLAEDIVRVLLGPMWGDAVPVFRLLAPTILAFALINPFSQLMQAGGHALRSVKLAFLIVPVVMLGYLLGLPYGPNGVALGFSVAMVTLVVPVVYWARKGTLITAMDLLRTASPPLLSTLIGTAAAFVVVRLCSDCGALLRLVVATAVLFTTHALVLLFVLDQKDVYADVLRAIRGDAPVSG